MSISSNVSALITKHDSVWTAWCFQQGHVFKVNHQTIVDFDFIDLFNCPMYIFNMGCWFGDLYQWRKVLKLRFFYSFYLIIWNNGWIFLLNRNDSEILWMCWHQFIIRVFAYFNFQISVLVLWCIVSYDLDELHEWKIAVNAYKFFHFYMKNAKWNVKSSIFHHNIWYNFLQITIKNSQ